MSHSAYIPHNYSIREVVPHAIPQTHSVFYPHRESLASVAPQDSSFQYPASLVAVIRAKTQRATKIVISQSKTLAPLKDGRVQFQSHVSLCTLVLFIQALQFPNLKPLTKEFFFSSSNLQRLVRRCGFTHPGFAVPYSLASYEGILLPRSTIFTTIRWKRKITWGANRNGSGIPLNLNVRS